MWSLMSRMGPVEPKFHLQQGGYHTTIHPFITNPLIPLQDKQFSYVKPANQESRMVHNYTNSVKAEPPKEDPKPNPLCNRKKKKRRRRRRKKNKKTPPQRQRQISVAESEDSFICFEKCESGSEFDSSDSLIPTKKVRFATGAQLCEVHHIVAWSFAYQAARKGPWEEYARDRDRFKQRIKSVEANIGYIFGGEHRDRIFRDRFD